MDVGDTAMDICCGTGRNFRFLQNKIGTTGKIIGIDLSAHMLKQARRIIGSEGWENVELIEVELIEEDVANYKFPQNVNGIISTFGMGLIPEYDLIIKKEAKALSHQGRLVIMDPQMPEKRPKWLQRFGIWIIKPFGGKGTLDAIERHTLKSVKKYFSKSSYCELYMGAIYLVVEEIPIKKP